VTSKEIHKCEVPKWKKEIVEIVCIFEKELPTIFMDLKVHLLIQLVYEIELEGVVSTRWMFFFERYMKTIKKKYDKRHIQRVVWMNNMY
jgi:hypothetical protein